MHCLPTTATSGCKLQQQWRKPSQQKAPVGNRRSLPPDLERLKPPARTAASQRCTAKALARLHTDPQQHRGSIDATTSHAVTPKSCSRLVASLLAQLLQAPAPIFLSLSLSLSLSL
uniref:Uncharacterized protein n=1 Tax=Fagus sylvatica TaxID=28930 RepID=A0A2N9J2L4_FAGSY